MSHTTTLKSVIIRDVTALRQASDFLSQNGVNCELKENAAPRMYYGGQQDQCDFVLKLKDGRYDVGFAKQEDGTLSPVFDQWNDYVANELGASCPMPDTPEGRAQHNIGKFFQQYSKFAAMNAAAVQGYTVETSDVDQEGNINLVLAGM